MFVLVGVTGGIAAYKTVHLVRALVLDGHEVHVIPTEDALRFVGRPTWEAISRHPVTTSVHDDVAQVRHVALGQQADLIVVAPATANFLAKFAAGLADDLLGTSLLATTAPVVVAPAMHTEMWRHPATTQNVEVLRARGVHVIGPDSGALTGGDVGPGRMSEPDAIHAYVAGLLAGEDPEGTRAKSLDGVRVLVTAGGTREPIDPVRYIGNRSSGKQGIAVATAAADRGAEVTVVLAHVDSDVLREASAHRSITLERAGTAAELGDAVARLAPSADVIVMAAAVADYRVEDASETKISKDSTDGALHLTLVETADVLAATTAARRTGQTIVGFAAETEPDPDIRIERARRKRERKGVDILALNEVGWTKGFESTDNTLSLIGADGAVLATVSGTKRETAEALWDAVLAVRGT
ncbi:bifunctional phosphopantothenoylcysteine decarboxylase/phosphopantothenate--cysteine ligase CoaBC [Microbacterium sp. ET2]|uniref:bifunctional phosphopantothenoylcysteine decarboxylase/phosphopantothenate--cysteine ligase CoaBC n=1 Tax=Microbacterium albipurpureum TaxID=3050384 RepID=UPI00259C6A3B|nr:bifunctional phosphopantothenoylcysteine decarboxylase/phosphopantothenate--cysteine ligase CoaBC [Microbacterium sp. ET2 (Ac-2212)]WJL94650.1 bifunctional phosphopantothenoylcysteine decarboxylase/phosphopantothenate--cysteine ligase CoaBC [Microbacterium sp. ET2 (Ac-2212)]